MGEGSGRSNLDYCISTFREKLCLQIKISIGGQVYINNARIEYGYYALVNCFANLDKKDDQWSLATGYNPGENCYIKYILLNAFYKPFIHRIDVTKDFKWATLNPELILAYETGITLNTKAVNKHPRMNDQQYIAFHKMEGGGALFVCADSTLKILTYDKHKECILDERKIIMFSLGSKIERCMNGSKKTHNIKFYGPCTIYIQTVPRK